ncbi:uncharacterized protein DUF4389 [Rhodovulum bhavnagarense]|uniref:Uncharacterized protein DUF4389 n=1 Tax=Rhodovulum bhavnagarense TaxID=992286 RepID=A0A4R2RUW9_9RHOB|nr:DUF4389 domain-containing protein [Rhodovulum bhavnagarense]TCP62935.1 uncharacterized protein DUF4389 [Rhodovulum bhavnagarense]
MTDAPDPTSNPSPSLKPVDKSAAWRRGAWMLVLLILFSIAHSVLAATAVLQFGWLLFTGKANPNISDFGEKLGNWLAMNARFQAVASEDKPFPWNEWK